MTRRLKFLFFAPVALAGLALFIYIGGEVTRLLWNWLLPPLFGWSELTFWQALGMLALCRILFGGVGGHRSGPSRMRGRMADRWDSLTPEERERFRQSVRDRFGFGPPAGGGSEPGPAPS